MFFFVLPTGVSQDGEKEEYVNESREFGDLGLFAPVLKLVERQGNQQEKLLTAEISNLIGRRLHDLDIMGAEVYSCTQLYYNINFITQVEVAVLNGSWGIYLQLFSPPF